MAAVLIASPQQFCDADGAPYAGGTLATFAPGTSTPKATWSDPYLASLNTNPVVLDSAGRCVVYGDGDYRLMLNDASGNLIWDQPSSTIVSAAMQPVMAAPTLAAAMQTLGVNAAIADEATARSEADSTLTNNLNAEVVRAEAAESTLTTDLNNEVTRATAAENAITTQINGLLSVRGGEAVTDSSGSVAVTFSPAFPTSCIALVACSAGPNWLTEVTSIIGSASGGTVYCYQDTGGGTPVSGRAVYWIAVGV
jgi:hypothetical protein